MLMSMQGFIYKICCSKNISCFSRALNIPSVIFSGSLHNFPDPQGHLKALVTNLIVGQVEYCNGLVDPKGISQGLEAWKNQPTNRVFQISNAKLLPWVSAA